MDLPIQTPAVQRDSMHREEYCYDAAPEGLLPAFYCHCPSCVYKDCPIGSFCRDIEGTCQCVYH